jgi:hypothetical protein
MKLQGLKKTGKTITVLNGDLAYSTQTFSLGSGEWSIEVYDGNGCFLKEFVGDNGVANGWNPEGNFDDLWSWYHEWCKEEHHSYTEWEAPDGKKGSFSFFMREANRGHLHGCLAVF